MILVLPLTTEMIGKLNEKNLGRKLQRKSNQRVPLAKMLRLNLKNFSFAKILNPKYVCDFNFRKDLAFLVIFFKKFHVVTYLT